MAEIRLTILAYLTGYTTARDTLERLIRAGLSWEEARAVIVSR